MKRGTIEHPKMRRLARTLGVHHLTAVGIMESLWHWTAKYAPCGDIGKHSDEDIADGIGICPDLSRQVPTASDFVRALVECGWLDRDETYRLVVHDWHQHADDAVKKAAERNKIALISKVKPPVATSPDIVATSPDKNRLPEPSHSHSQSLAMPPAESDQATTSTPDQQPSNGKTNWIFPVTGNPEVLTWALPRDTYELLTSSYPAVKTDEELRKAIAWCTTNKSNRKTANGMPRFLNAWFERAQNGTHPRQPTLPNIGETVAQRVERLSQGTAT